ncbi:MAG: tRNA 4-thiouridine(8) synthase ThiI [Candidatus Altiarchaeales archaeon]|nr:MAG: tRNA 4-thiouridine(8) synthase ThiI [Candidatus Altiarchaeales archaeon]
MFDTVIVRYGEIFLKSEFVRKKFEKELLRNIKFRLKNSGFEFKFIRKRHRIYIKSSNAEVMANSLRNVFGIVSISPAIQTNAEINSIRDTAVRFAESILNKGDTFAIITSRSGEHEFKSQDINSEIGGEILKRIKDVSVNLDNPEKRIYIEIRDDLAFVFDKKIPGVGGLPYKTQGRVVVLVSGGIDSSVAAWMMAKRGCELIGVHLGSEEEIKNIMEVLERYTGYKIKIYSFEYDNILERISDIAGKYTCIVCKRAMLRIASRIAKMENASGIVTGENIGQVASQTLKNLKVISSVYSPIYRPLIGMDKDEIIKIAKKIGVYEFSTSKSCRYVPGKPATTSKLKKIEEIENKIGIGDLIEKLMKGCQNQ